MNKTSLESAAQDDFQEVKRRKRHIYNNTSQAAKKSTKPFPTSAAVKMPPKAVLTYNIFTPLRTTEAEKTVGEGNSPTSAAQYKKSDGGMFHQCPWNLVDTNDGISRSFFHISLNYW
jgi:hypothetical protein